MIGRDDRMLLRGKRSSKELERALLGFNQKYFRARHVVRRQKGLACVLSLAPQKSDRSVLNRQLCLQKACSVSAFSGDLLRSDSEQESPPQTVSISVSNACCSDKRRLSFAGWINCVFTLSLSFPPLVLIQSRELRPREFKAYPWKMARKLFNRDQICSSQPLC